MTSMRVCNSGHSGQSVLTTKFQQARKIFSLTLLAAAVGFWGGNAQAANGTWTQLTSGGLWSATANWSGTTVANAGTANFNTIDITADNTVHLDSARTITGLTFGDTATGTAASWILDNNGNAANTLTGISTITVNALGTGKSATISAVIAGTSAIIKSGAGTLVLSGANTLNKTDSNNASFAWRLDTTGGIVVIASDSAFGVTTGTGFMATTLINLNGATLQASGSARTVANPVWLNTASITVSGDQSITFSGTVSGRSTNPTLYNNITGAGTLSLINNVYTDNLSGAKTITFAGTGNTFITGVIANNTGGVAVNGNIIKSGTGTLTLSNINTYTGTTAVSGGTLLVNSPGSLHASSAVSVANTAIFGGSGTINGTVSVSNGGTIQPTLSGSVGTLTLANAASPTFAATGTLKIRVPTSSAADQVYLSNSGASFACGNLNLVIDVAGLSGNASGLTIVSTAKANGVTGTFPLVTLINNPNSYTYNLDYSDTSKVKLSLTGSGGTTYTVTFNNNGGSGTMTAQTGSSAAPLTSNTFTKTGYTFAGWNTVAGGGGTAYADGASYAFTASTTLYAQWTANTYTVTFDGNGGDTPSPTSKSVTYASTYGTLATVTRTGYTFNGWFTATSGGTQVTSGTTVAITGAQTLYAQWTAASATITLADSLSAVNTTYGTASATPTSFHVSGSDLTGNLTVTPPTGYEVSLSSGSGYTTSLSITASGTLSSTLVYVRLAATTTVNGGAGYTGNITVSGGGASSQTIATASSTVAKADATVVVTPYTVIYDGNPHTATVTSITGVLGETGATVGTVTLNTTHTAVGVYTDSWSFAGTANYNDIGTSTTTVNVSNGSFETPALPNNSTYWWALGSPWVGGISPQGYEVLDMRGWEGATFSSAADGFYAVNLESWLVSVTQDLGTTVNAGDTLSMTFSGGRAKGQAGGKFTATFKVGTTEYTSSEFDTSLLANDTWQSYPFTTQIANTGNLSIKFSYVSGNRPWLDKVSNVSRTSGSGTQTITDRIKPKGTMVSFFSD